MHNTIPASRDNLMAQEGCIVRKRAFSYYSHSPVDLVKYLEDIFNNPSVQPELQQTTLRQTSFLL